MSAAAAYSADSSSCSDSDVEIIESKCMAAKFMDPRWMYAQIPSGRPTPPQSPSDDSWPTNQAAAMPLVTDLLARNGQVNVPPGFVLCIPCYLCKQPFNDIETFKEHLTQHAAEINAWQAARERASQEPPIQPPIQPMFQPFLQPSGHPAGPYMLPMEFPQQQPPMVSIPGPIQPPIAVPMPLTKPMIRNQPPMQFPMHFHQQMAVLSSLELPDHCSVHPPPPPPIHQRVHRSVPLTSQSPLEMMEHQFGFQRIRPIPPPHQQPHQPPMELPRKPHFMVQQVPPPVELQRIVLQKPIETREHQLPKEQPPQAPEKNLKDQFCIETRLQIGDQRIRQIPPPHQSPMELPRKPQFVVQQVPPPVELQRIVLKKPIEAREHQLPKEQPPQALEKNLKDQFCIESRLQIPPSMELQRIVLQKPQEPPLQSPLQRIVLQKPQEPPLQSPIEIEENQTPVEQPQPKSPEKDQISNQREQPLISPAKELQQKPSQPPLERPSSARFQCEYCGKKLSSRQSVRYHESRFHLMEEPPTYKIGKDVQKHFKCATCKKRYKRRTFLLMHMKIKHGICGSETTAPATIPPATVESPAEDPPSTERPISPSSSEEARREVWSTKVFNAVAAASYSPATESAAKYVNAPRQQSEQLDSEFGAKPKRVYPMRSPFFNPDLWLDCDAYF